MAPSFKQYLSLQRFLGDWENPISYSRVITWADCSAPIGYTSVEVTHSPYWDVGINLSPSVWLKLTCLSQDALLISAMTSRNCYPQPAFIGLLRTLSSDAGLGVIGKGAVGLHFSSSPPMTQVFVISLVSGLFCSLLRASLTLRRYPV